MMCNRKLALIPAALAATSLVASPANAAELPAPVSVVPIESAQIWTPGDDSYDHHRRYRHRRHRGVSAGDVLAGVLIVGGIAAIASSAKRSEDRRYRERDNRYPGPYRGDYRQGYDAREIDRAVDICAAEIQRDVRIDSIDTVNRAGSGWQVTGSLFNGDGFTCTIGRDGRIDAIDYGQNNSYYSGGYIDQDLSSAAPAQGDDRQYEDAFYASARAQMDGQQSAQPAYPGGPLPGETGEQPEVEMGTGYKGAGN